MSEQDFTTPIEGAPAYTTHPKCGFCGEDCAFSSAEECQEAYWRECMMEGTHGG